MLAILTLYTLLSFLLSFTSLTSASNITCPAPPDPETITVREISLPPVSGTGVGDCNRTINPKGTGCISRALEAYSGNFLPDNQHIVRALHFVGAPAAPDPASIYTGLQVVVMKTDGSNFASGSHWKCITSGVSPERMKGTSALSEYPYRFADGRRVPVGHNIVDGGAYLASDASTAETTSVYPIQHSLHGQVPLKQL